MSAAAAEATPARAAAPALAGPAARRTRRLGNLARRLIAPAILGAVWCAVTYGGLVRALYVPSPSQLYDAFHALSGALPSATLTSTTMTLTGFALGAVIGIGLGLLIAASRVARTLLGDVLDFTRPVPVFALIPLFLLWFGIGRGPQIALIALGTSVVLGVTTLEAVRNVDPVHVRAARTLGAGRWDVYRTVVVPSAFPHLLGAIRVAAAASWGLDVAAELIGSQNGLGYLMIVRQQYLDTAGILAVVVVYSTLALLLDRAIVIAQRPLTRWTHRDLAGP
jgi:ABC-type nitrate/sulfonate/bicarbonate transport system permease component